MESAGMGLWPRVDLAICPDGRCGVVGLARRRMEKAASASGIISSSMAAECAVDAALFWAAPIRSSIRGNYFSMAGAGGYAAVVLASSESRWRFAGSLSGLGNFRRHAELHHLAV